jgi:hypothetical protein
MRRRNSLRCMRGEKQVGNGLLRSIGHPQQMVRRERQWETGGR